MLILEKDDPALFRRVQAQNLNRQYGLLMNCIEVGIEKGPVSFDKYLLWALNHVAVANLCQLGGRFRKEPVSIGNHQPPHFLEVDDLMDRFITTVQENWFDLTPTALAAYGLWRLNWIHPFVDGNGRTARAACYFLVCVRAKSFLPGTKILPDRIRESRENYIAALRAADEAWERGVLDFSQMEEYIAQLLGEQLSHP